jgi:hypothetical protein
VPQNKSIAEVVSELWQLFVSYAKQETVEPVRGLFRGIGFRLGAMFFFAFGILLLTLSALRFLEAHTSTHLQGHWSWVPYIAALIFMLALIAFAVTRITAKGDSG